MSNSIVIPNRLNWIDWAKTIAITFVVFGHIPMEKGNFIQNYIVIFHMPFFFFISGFLTKKEFLDKRTLEKYVYTLIIPYFFYNIIFYPYWVVRHIIDYPTAGWYDFLKPIIGVFMLQHKTAYFESLNGVTWFISSLLIMKLFLSICNKYKYGKIFLTIIVILDAILYIFNEHYRYCTDLPFVGFTRCLPFFILGHLCKQKNIIKDKPHNYDLIISTCGICLSLFTYCLLKGHGILQYGICFWITCLSAISGIFSLCKLLDRFHFTIIDNISIGTIVIMGLHWILIGVTNYSLSKMLHIVNGITYPWYIAISLALTYIAFLYPIIILIKNRHPLLLGKWKASLQIKE